MPFSLTTDKVHDVAADAVVIGLFAESALTGPAEDFNSATSGLLAKLIEAKEITGKKCETVTLLAPPGIKAPVALVVGLGPKTSLDRGIAYRAASAAAKSLASKERGKVAFYLGDKCPAEVTTAAICGSGVGCVGQDLYRAKKNRFPFGQVLWSGVDQSLLTHGEILSDAVNLTRRLVNEPPSEI